MVVKMRAKTVDVLLHLINDTDLEMTIDGEGFMKRYLFSHKTRNLLYVYWVDDKELYYFNSEVA